MRESKYISTEYHQTTRKWARKKKEQKNYKRATTQLTKMIINTYQPIITLTEIKSPITRHNVTEWIKIQNLSICCLQEAHSRCMDIYTDGNWRDRKGNFMQIVTKRKVGSYTYIRHVDVNTKTRL